MLWETNTGHLLRWSHLPTMLIGECAKCQPLCGKVNICCVSYCVFNPVLYRNMVFPVFCLFVLAYFARIFIISILCHAAALLRMLCYIISFASQNAREPAKNANKHYMQISAGKNATWNTHKNAVIFDCKPFVDGWAYHNTGNTAKRGKTANNGK